MKTLYLLLAGLLAGSSSGLPAEESLNPGNGSPTLAELARKADFIALGQVRETDYRRQREIPVSGSAYLRILIPYKGERDAELVEIYEKGLHDGECYFPTPTVFEEGRRYLLFLRRDPDRPERYRGLTEGCAIDVLVDSDNRYAVRVPITGIRISDPLQALARPMEFSDPYAIVDDASLPDRDTEPATLWRYTKGISLAEFRSLMQLD